MAEKNREIEHDRPAEVKITDRRAFTSDGRPRAGAPVESDDAPRSEPEATETTEEPSRQAEDPGFERRPIEEPQGVDFTMLINAMAEPALLFLGEIPHPSTGQPTVDLERARIQIDMLDLLRIKCRGNLTTEEDGLLDRILYQLRMLYVSRSNAPEPDK